MRFFLTTTSHTYGTIKPSCRAAKILLRSLHVLIGWRIQLVLILTFTNRFYQISNGFETGLYNFNKLTFTVLKACLQKQKPKVIKYRNYKNFGNNRFRNDLMNELLSKKTFKPNILIHLKLLHSIYLSHAPLKEKTC